MGARPSVRVVSATILRYETPETTGVPLSNSKSDANETGVCQGDEGLASERGVCLEIARRHRKRKLAVLVVLAIVAATAAKAYGWAGSCWTYWTKCAA